MCNLDHWGGGGEGTGIQVHAGYSTLSDGSQTGVSVRPSCSAEKTEREG